MTVLSVLVVVDILNLNKPIFYLYSEQIHAIKLGFKSYGLFFITLYVQNLFGTVVTCLVKCNLFLSLDGVLGGTSHPVHIHGQKVQVIKTGFPSYDPDTNFLTEISTDFEVGQTSVV